MSKNASRSAQGARTLTVTFSLRMPLTTLAALVKLQQEAGFNPRSRSEAVHAAIEALLAGKPRPTEEEASVVLQELTRGRDLNLSQLRVSRGGIEQAFGQLSQGPNQRATGPGSGGVPGPLPDLETLAAEAASELEEPDPEDFRLNRRSNPN